MVHYAYKVVPAPTKGLKAKGVKTPEGRFAQSVQSVLNTLGAEGWEYLRAELLPSDERSGLTGSTTNWRNVLVFRRPIAQAGDADDPVITAPVPAERSAPEDTKPEPPMASGAERMLKDNGVEELSPVSGMTTALTSRAARQAEQVEDDAAATNKDEDQDKDGGKKD